MNSVGSGFYEGLLCDRGCKGTNQKIIIRVASSRKLSLGQIYNGLCESARTGSGC